MAKIEPGKYGQQTCAVRSGQVRTPENENSEPIFLSSSFVFVSAAEAAARLATQGPNRIADQPRRRLLLNFLARFPNPVILMLFADSYREILKLKKVHQMASIPAETQVLDCDHEQIGRLLLDRWNMPDSTKACAEYHHRYRDCDNHGDQHPDGGNECRQRS